MLSLEHFMHFAVGTLGVGLTVSVWMDMNIYEHSALGMREGARGMRPARLSS